MTAFFTWLGSWVFGWVVLAYIVAMLVTAWVWGKVLRLLAWLKTPFYLCLLVVLPMALGYWAYQESEFLAGLFTGILIGVSGTIAVVALLALAFGGDA